MNFIAFYLIALVVSILAFSHQTEAKREFELLEFHVDSLPIQCKFAGEFLGGARWSDANGENFLVVSQNFKTGVDAGVQEIYGYNYVLDSGKCKLLWQWHDENENLCDMGEGLVSTVETDDLDGDGIGESAFIYSIEGACDISPRLFTLVFHSGTTTHSMHGTNRVQIDEKTFAGGEIQSDSTFDSSPLIYEEFCSSLLQKVLD